MRHVRSAGTRVLALLLCIAGQSMAGDADERILVDGDVRITAGMYRQEVSRLPAEAQARLRSNPDLARREVVDELFRRLKLVQEAERRGLADDPDVAYRIQVARENVLAGALMDDIRNGIAVPDLEQRAEETYKAEKQAFLIPEGVHVRHILLRPAEDGGSRREEAETLLASLRAGADFAELALRHSEDGSAAAGGDLGWVVRGQTVAPFEQAAFALQEPGELSGVVESRFGLHLIRLEKRRGARVQAFEEVKPRIVDQLRSEYIRDQTSAEIRRLTDPGGATVYQDVIDEVVRGD